MSIAVASPTSIVQDNSHLLTTMSLHCDKQCLSRLLPRHLLFRTIAIYGQPCHSIVTAMAYCVHCRTYIVTWQYLSIDSIARLLRLTMSIDTHFSGATVAAMFYFLSIVQGVSTSYIIYPLTLTAHCPKYQNALLRTMYIDRQRC